MDSLHNSRSKRDEKEESLDEDQHVGDVNNIDDVDNSMFAKDIGIDPQETRTSTRDDRLDDVDDPATASILEDVLKENEQLREETQELRKTVEDQRQTIKELAARMNEFNETVDETREISKSAVATAHQVEERLDQEVADENEDTSTVNRTLSSGVEPSSSLLDFLANCRDESIRQMFVSKSNRKNSYRAVRVAKRWDEFARKGGDQIVWKRTDVEQALTAEMGERPHPETVTRVWDKLVELGSDDLEETRRKRSNRQDGYDVIRMDERTAKQLQEGRYLQLDLLEDTGGGTAGGVTAVVTGNESMEV